MKNNKKIFLVLVLGLFINITVNAQDSEGDNRDFENWSSVALVYKPIKKLSLGLEQQYRFNDNASELEQYFTQLEAGYKVLKHIQLGGELRYSTKNDISGANQGHKNRLRSQLNLAYGHKLDRFSFKYKLAYQSRTKLEEDEKDEAAKQTFRFKTSVAYNIKKWPLDPKLSGEIFNNVGTSKDLGYSKYRLTLGTKYRIKKVGDISIFYRFEKELNVKTPDVSDILGLKFTYTIKN